MSMIRILTPMVLLGLMAETRAEDKIKVEDLPRAVASAVKKAYPEAKIVGVSKEKDDEGETVFEVEMKLDGKSIDLILDDEGEIEETEKEIEVEDLPRAVLKVARSKFPGAKITKVEEVTDEDDTVVYELAFAVEGKKSFEVVMSPSGKVLETEDEDEDDDKAESKNEDDEKGKSGEKDKHPDKKKDKDDDDHHDKKDKPKD